MPCLKYFSSINVYLHAILSKHALNKYRTNLLILCNEGYLNAQCNYLNYTLMLLKLYIRISCAYNICNAV